MIILGEGFFLVFAISLGYYAWRFWHQRNTSDRTDKSPGFRPRIGFTQLDGMESISLLLANGSNINIWAEEIEILLSALAAEAQTSEPSCSGILKIRQMVGPGDTVPVSLAGVIYKAAGEPQRKYSCVLSSVLRYRIGEERLEKKMENCRIRMIGLTADDVVRERSPIYPFQTHDKSQDIPVVGARLK
jgi:hypothetical protein